MNLTKVTDYLSNQSQIAADNKLLTEPAILFEDKTDTQFGSIFLFERFGHAESNSYRITSQITKHYMEDNVSRNDHWSIGPDTYVLSGFIGEVVYRPPKLWRNKAEKYVTDYLKPLGMLSPTFDSYTQSALNAVQMVELSYRRYEQIAKNIYNNLTDSVTKRNQAYVTKLLKQAQIQRQLFNVWTPFRTLENLAIASVSITQGDTKYKSRLEITFEQWRDVSSNNIREATEEEKQAYLAKVQKMEEQNSGTCATQDVSIAKQRLLRGEQPFWNFN